MSSYLQRMIAGAATPARTLRPFAGPMLGDRPGEFRKEVSAVRTSAAEKFEPFPTEEPLPSVERRPEKISQVASPATSVPEPWHDLPAHDDARLLPRHAHATSVRRDQSGPREDEAEAEARDKDKHRVRPMPSPQLLVERFATENLEQQDRGPAEQRITALMPMPAAVAAATQRLPRQLRAQQREAARDSAPQDVQIHIGRIEVIAVPPPSQRAAAPKSKSTSLDDYLNHANGRRR
jgi:hypothetical protein